MLHSSPPLRVTEAFIAKEAAVRASDKPPAVAPFEDVAQGGKLDAHVSAVAHTLPSGPRPAFVVVILRDVHGLLGKSIF
jgi:hypothetical protein